jgi:Zn finger protein HypA/HybF involved in hydrogenase expression
MHEAGLARAAAGTIRTQGLAGERLRLVVSGGHAEPADFDAAFRFHLSVVAPDLAGSIVEIVHLPAPRQCVGCGLEFTAVGEVPCPACGGPALPGAHHEELELERIDPGVSDDLPDGAVTFSPPEGDGGTGGGPPDPLQTGDGATSARGPDEWRAPPGPG